LNLATGNPSEWFKCDHTTFRLLKITDSSYHLSAGHARFDIHTYADVQLLDGMLTFSDMGLRVGSDPAKADITTSRQIEGGDEIAAAVRAAGATLVSAGKGAKLIMESPVNSINPYIAIDGQFTEPKGQNPPGGQVLKTFRSTREAGYKDGKTVSKSGNQFAPLCVIVDLARDVELTGVQVKHGPKNVRSFAYQTIETAKSVEVHSAVEVARTDTGADSAEWAMDLRFDCCKTDSSSAKSCVEVHVGSSEAAAGKSFAVNAAYTCPRVVNETNWIGAQQKFRFLRFTPTNTRRTGSQVQLNEIEFFDPDGKKLKVSNAADYGRGSWPFTKAGPGDDHCCARVYENDNYNHQTHHVCVYRGDAGQQRGEQTWHIDGDETSSIKVEEGCDWVNAWDEDN